MKLSRSSRLVAAAITLFSLLFMQLAMASYMCPAESIDHDSQMVLMAEANGSATEMAACLDMDPVEPSLCHAHANADHQSLDKHSVPSPQPFMAAGSWVLPSPAELAPPPLSASPEATSLTHANAPPLAIRNCCFRI